MTRVSVVQAAFHDVVSCHCDSCQVIHEVYSDLCSAFDSCLRLQCSLGTEADMFILRKVIPHCALAGVSL